GTLKSSLCLSIAAYNAATERRPSLYITLEESRESLQVQARSLGLPFEDAGGLLMFLDGRDLRASVPRAGEDWVDAFAAALEVTRRIRIVKMRGTRHETGYMAFLVDEGRLRATRAMAP